MVGYKTDLTAIEEAMNTVYKGNKLMQEVPLSPYDIKIYP